jgi:surface antigen
MSRALLLSGLLALAPVAAFSAMPVTAQGVGERCAETPAKKAKRSLFGGIMGGLASNVLGRAGVPTSVAGVYLPVGSLLSDAIINLLDCKEQQQAAKATDEAVRGGVGTEVAWTSESRPNVSGKSKVTAEEKLANGGQCLTVNDVVIVDGEETVVPKRMCRAPGASGYAKV